MARGDLGVEIPMETLTNVQKDLVRRSNLAGAVNVTMLVSRTDNFQSLWLPVRGHSQHALTL